MAFSNSIISLRYASRKSKYLPEVFLNSQRLGQYRSLSSIKATSSPPLLTDFPWLKITDKPRIQSYPYPKLPIITFLPRFMHGLLTNSLTDTGIRMTFDKTYFPQEFLTGASMAFQRFAQFISESPTESNLNSLQNILTKDLYNRLAPFLQVDRNMSPDGPTLSLRISNIGKSSIIDMFASIGGERSPEIISPFTLFNKGINPTNEFANAIWNGTIPNIGRWGTLEVCFPPLQQIVAEVYPDMAGKPLPVGADGSVSLLKQFPLLFHLPRLIDIATRCLNKGVQIFIDVGIDVDMEFEASNGPNMPRIVDNGRRLVIIRLDSGYITPSSNLKQAWQDGYLRWRISDIDYLLEKQYLEIRGEDY